MRSSRAVLGAVLAMGVLVVATAAGIGAGRWRDESSSLERALSTAAAAAERDAHGFLARYVEPDGRVVRSDEGDDTVSEGQAYAMLLAVGIGDRETFDRVWSWSVEHIRRDDWPLSWRWDGRVLDPEPAADADLDTSWALALAAERWPDGGYGEEAVALAAAIEAHETAASAAGGRVLAAGPWAVGDPIVVNPSYASPVADSVLASGGHATATVASGRSAGNRAVVNALIDQRSAPSDWAHLADDGDVVPADDPIHAGSGRFGWDAVRVPLRYGASCDPADRHVAARIWPAMEAGAGVDLLGDHPARLVGAAAAAAAAGELERAFGLLDEATAADERAPTYYGSALTALGRMLLATDWLGGCPPLRSS